MTKIYNRLNLDKLVHNIINMADCMDILFLIRSELESHKDWNSVKNENTANILIISVLHISSNLHLKANTYGLKFIIYVSLLYHFLLKYCCIHSLCTLWYMLHTFTVTLYMLHTFIVLHYVTCYTHSLCSIVTCYTHLLCSIVTCYTHSLMLLVFINHICLSALHKATLHYWLIDCFMLLHISDVATFLYLESEFDFCIVCWYLVSTRTFCVMYDPPHFYACKSPDLTLGHTLNGMSAGWLQMTT